MDKTLFIQLLDRYTDSTEAEAQEIISLKDAYPYSQLLQTLSARVSKDHGFENHQELLQSAAVHAADRNLLKEIILAESSALTASPGQPAKQNEIKSEVSASLPEDDPAPAVENPFSGERDYTIQSIESVDLADEVMRDLEKLNALRHNFEMMMVEYSEVKAEPGPSPAPKDEPAPPPPSKDIDSTAETKSALPEATANEFAPTETAAEKAEAGTGTEASAVHAPAKRESKEALRQKGKSKKERIIELVRQMEKTEVNAAEPVVRAGKKTSPKTNNPADALIDEIEAKNEITPESDKQKEQLEIINQFIKTQPSISSAKERPAPAAADLTPIKTGEFGDNIVSETLVEILIKQGKKDKAIEVLKKLIWKFPQKKSYFAGQIEDLKK